MKAKLFDYVQKDNVVYNLSGVTKLIAFLCLTFSVMFSYDIRFIIAVMVMSFVILHISEIKYSQIRLMLIYTVIFLVLNFILTFLFNPTYGTEIYGTRHELFAITKRYTVTSEQLLYQTTKLFKYGSVIPLGMIFLLTTNPSEFASGINRIGVPFKAAYALALTLRYFPDVIRDYNNISVAQQARGLDMSAKEKTSVRVKNIMSIVVPLIFSTMDRIDVISNAMDLRGFGKKKLRTWYTAKKLDRSDRLVIAGSILVLACSLGLSTFVNHSRFWNPFI